MTVIEMAAEQETLVKFAPFSSAVDVAFWHKLKEKKLEVYQLDDKPKAVRGNFTNSDLPGLPCRLNLDYNAFDIKHSLPPKTFLSHGVLNNTNTIEAFWSFDKKKLIDASAIEIWDAIKSGAAVEDPSILCKFILLTYANEKSRRKAEKNYSQDFMNLKKFNFYYWFAFPGLVPKVNATSSVKPTPLAECFTSSQISSLLSSYDALCQNEKLAFFLVKVCSDEVKLAHFKDWATFFKDEQKVMVGFADPCTLPGNPGWPLRNFLALVAYHWGHQVTSVQVLCFRDRMRGGKRETGHSIVLNVNLPVFSKTDVPKCAGWEKDENQKLLPRKVNLSATMDPTRLAESSVDLNLQLMRWRLLPSLNLEQVSSTRCLLLGAGTLGCNVARCLMGWGVRTITFVDNSRVSFSNPVRQTLFEFEDCKAGGKLKAEAAAESLKRIFPGVNSSGVVMSIPMPGHPVGTCAEELERVKRDVEQLEQLIDTHDVVFLLMDTRESRWLPTVIAATKRKLVINAALGFDTFLVMRHGAKGSAAQEGASSLTSIPGSRLGCYFCNDVVAPGNSTRDRTLDQQCTVSRPGMSFISSALAVELLVSILQHPEGFYAAADTSAKDDHLTADLQSPLGVVPHQIRGFLSRYHVVLPASLAFDKCIACSETVLTNYETEGFSFLEKVFNLPQYLENLTGLTKLLQDALVSEVWEMSDEETLE